MHEPLLPKSRLIHVKDQFILCFLLVFSYKIRPKETYRVKLIIIYYTTLKRISNPFY